MITVTLPWWGWLAWIFCLIIVSRLAAWCGEKLGRATYRWWANRKEGKDDLQSVSHR